MKKRYLLFISSLLFSTLLFGQQPYNQVSKGGTPWSYKHIEYDQNLGFVSMPFTDNQSLLNEDALYENDKTRRYRFGYDHYVSYNLTNSGTWTELPDGGKIWRLGIQSVGALELSFAFKSVYLPEGSRLFVMNYERTEKHGAFDQSFVSSDHILPTELLSGDKAIIELYVPADGISNVSLELYRVTHAYRSLADLYNRSFLQSGPCHNNVRCPAYASYDNQIRSVCCLVDGGEFCTGALINNTCNDAKPYVLTANHCYSNPSSWTFRFNWEASGCTTPGSSPSSNSLTGGTLRSRNAGSDFCLVEINSAVPSNFNAYWAGWDRNNVASTNPYCIHHPSGDIKKISFSTGTAISSTFSGAATWRTPTWTDGVTEPGSSGSPLFNSSGQIVGQLYGGPSNCSLEGNPSGGYDEYGKIFTSWTGGGTNATRLSNWLDPSACNTGATTLNGYDPNAVSLQWDADILSITTPSGSYCTGTLTPVVVLKNNGTNTITSCTITYIVDGGAPQNYNWTGNLTSGSTTNVTLPNISVGNGAHTYSASSSNPNGNADQNSSNDGASSNFTVSAGGTVVNPTFTEGFQGTFLPANWSAVDGGGDYWEQANTGFNSTKSAMFDNFTNDNTGDRDDMLSPILDISSIGTPTLTFDVAYARYNTNNTYSDTLQVLVSTNCGSTWTSVYLKGGTTLASAPNTTSAFVPTTGQWRTETVNLSAYSGATTFQLAIRNRSGYGQNLYVDNINISGSSSAGIDETNINESVTVYPNPTSSFVNIQTLSESGFEYTVMNLLGDVLLNNKIIQSGTTQVDLSGFSAGIYLIKVKIGKMETTKRVVLLD